MATIILDLQPVNQVNRYLLIVGCCLGVHSQALRMYVRIVVSSVRQAKLGLGFTSAMYHPMIGFSRAGFQLLLANADPSFSLSSDFYYRQLLKKIYTKGKLAIKNFIQKDSPTSVSLSMDGWSQHHHGYLGAIANYITPDWRRQALCIGVKEYNETHTSKHLAEWIVKSLDEWEWVPKTEVIVTDTASNMLGIINKYLVPELPDHLIPGKVCKNLISFTLYHSYLFPVSLPHHSAGNQG